MKLARPLSFMRSELQGLEITKGELKHLSGLGSHQVYRPATWQNLAQEGCQTLMIGLLLLLSYGILVLVFEQHHILLIIIHLIAAIAILVDEGYKISVSLQNSDLLQIFDEVDRYNSIVQSLVLHDELEQAGNREVKIYHREQVISALNLIRSDLVRALKTAKILRQNHQFIAQHPDLLETDLNTLATPFCSDETTEPGRLLQESLQLATEVHQKLKQLHQKQSPH